MEIEKYSKGNLSHLKTTRIFEKFDNEDDPNTSIIVDYHKNYNTLHLIGNYQLIASGLRENLSKLTRIINNLNEVKQKVTQNSVNEEIEFGLDSKILDFLLSLTQSMNLSHTQKPKSSFKFNFFENNIAGDDIIDGFLNKKKTGYGFFIEKDRQYFGSIKNGKYDGIGILIRNIGEIYYGNWNDGLKEGQGTYFWPDGSVYKGEFKNNEIKGKGIIRYANGDIYEGDFLESKRHGKGRYIQKNTHTHIHVGEWERGKLTISLT